MDYLDLAHHVRHASWSRYCAARRAGRLVLLTTRGTVAYHRFAFRQDDNLLLGRESSGVPEEIHAAADARLAIPLRAPARSLNVALAASMVLGEAMRQTGQWPEAAQ